MFPFTGFSFNDKRTAIAAENRKSLPLNNHVCYCLYICTRPSAKMLKLLMAKVISIDRLHTVDCFAGKSWHSCGCQLTQTSHPNGQAHPTWRSDDMGPPAEQWGTWKRAQDIYLASKRCTSKCEWATWNIHKHAQPWVLSKICTPFPVGSWWYVTGIWSLWTTEGQDMVHCTLTSSLTTMSAFRSS